jgi:hypothetical protein
MNLNRGFWSTLFMLLAFVFFVWLAIVEGGVVSSTDVWQLGAGLASMALSFLLGGGWANWNNVP